MELPKNVFTLATSKIYQIDDKKASKGIFEKQFKVVQGRQSIIFIDAKAFFQKCNGYRRSTTDMKGRYSAYGFTRPRPQNERLRY